MANRWMNQFFLSFVKGKAVIYGQFSVGAAGAPTLSAVNSQGVASITRNSAGRYTIVLQDTWVKFLQYASNVTLSGSAPAVKSYYVVSQTVSAPATKNLVVEYLNSGGTATDPDNGAVINFEIVLNNSTAR
jgi:hypothetical protein